MHALKSFALFSAFALLALPVVAAATPPAVPAAPDGGDALQPVPAEATKCLTDFFRFLEDDIPPGTEPGPGVFGDGCYGYCYVEITCNVNGTFQLLSCTGWSSCDAYSDFVMCDGTTYTCEQCFWTFQRTCEYC